MHGLIGKGSRLGCRNRMFFLQQTNCGEWLECTLLRCYQVRWRKLYEFP